MPETQQNNTPLGMQDLTHYDELIKQYISEQENSNTYTLPTASTTTKGGVKVDGTTIVIDNNGVISSPGGNEPITVEASSIISSGDIYSTAERIIGCWTDGKPLYQRVLTIISNMGTQSQYQKVNHNIANVERIWVYDGYARNSSSGFTNQLNLSNDTLTGQWYVAIDNTKVNTWAGSNRTAYDEVRIVVRYTKTTDAVNSFTNIDSATVLPAASTSVLGGVKVDGTTITVNANGVISATQPAPYELPKASTSQLGGVKVDGTTVTIDSNGVISAVGGGGSGESYSLPTASTTTKGGIKVDGTTVTVDANDVLHATQPTPYSLPEASGTTLGGVKIDGTTITKDANGVISATQPTPYSLPTASTETKGGVKVDGTTITIDANGVISAEGGGGSSDITYITSEQIQSLFSSYDTNSPYYSNEAGSVCTGWYQSCTKTADGESYNGILCGYNGGYSNWVAFCLSLSQTTAQAMSYRYGRIDGNFTYEGKTWYYSTDSQTQSAYGQNVDNTNPVTKRFYKEGSIDVVTWLKELLDTMEV